MQDPVGRVDRAVQVAVCKTAEAGAIPARDSISPSISVERYTPVAVRKDLPNRNTGRATLMLVHFSRREPVSVRTSQAWLRRFNSPFASRPGARSEEHTSE